VAAKSSHCEAEDGWLLKIADKYRIHSIKNYQLHYNQCCAVGNAAKTSYISNGLT
jgi:hypothetical protein